MARAARVCISFIVVAAVFFASATPVSAKVHVIVFGKWTSVQWNTGLGATDKSLPLKIRALIVDGQLKEYMVGAPHDVTERLFVARRAFRVAPLTASSRIARRGEDQYFLRRLPMNSLDDISLFSAKLEGAYDWLYTVQSVSKLIRAKIRRTTNLSASQGRLAKTSQS